MPSKASAAWTPAMGQETEHRRADQAAAVAQCGHRRQGAGAVSAGGAEDEREHRRHAGPGNGKAQDGQRHAGRATARAMPRLATSVPTHTTRRAS
jgi:hypothetical protein